MNRKTIYPLPSRDGKVILKGCDKPLPPQIAQAISELGNPTLRSGGVTRLCNAMESLGPLLSRRELCDILIENNGESVDEAKAIVAGLKFHFAEEEL